LGLSERDLKTLPDSTVAFGVKSEMVFEGNPSEKSNIFDTLDQIIANLDKTLAEVNKREQKD
jgi:hypothetical protein